MEIVKVPQQLYEITFMILAQSEQYLERLPARHLPLALGVLVLSPLMLSLLISYRWQLEQEVKHCLHQVVLFVL